MFSLGRAVFLRSMLSEIGALYTIHIVGCVLVLVCVCAPRCLPFENGKCMWHSREIARAEHCARAHIHTHTKLHFTAWCAHSVNCITSKWIAKARCTLFIAYICNYIAMLSRCVFVYRFSNRIVTLEAKTHDDIWDTRYIERQIDCGHKCVLC